MKSTSAHRPQPPPAPPEPCLPGVAAALGIDVSKHSFNVCLLASKDVKPQHGKFASSPEGHAAFITWLQRTSQGRSVHICLEETGSYGLALAAFLHQAGHHVSLVNAALIKNHARSLNLRNKNDPLDAWMIATYALERVPARWRPLSGSHQKLRDLARRRHQI